MYLRLLLSLLLIHFCRAAGPGRFRIIAGRKADIREFPYQASIEHYGQQWCGGSIIHKKAILTAAHCVQTIKNQSPVSKFVMRVRVGTSMSNQGGEVFMIERAIPHERYNEDPNVDDHDIAVIVLVSPLVYSDTVKSIPYAKFEPSDGAMAWVTGYGRQDPMRRMANRHLMAAELPITNREVCRFIYSALGNVVTNNMICAGGSSGQKDSCKGDSGGPLASGNTLVGVVAWGIGCGREGLPGVYTNVAKYALWIEYKLNDIKDWRR